MDSQNIGAARPAPSFAPAKNTAQQSLPAVAASARSGVQEPKQVSEPASLSPASDGPDYTISVDEVLIRLHELGINKSKDTIQRYCREGDLDCEKLGMFRRYFATEHSVEKLIEKLEPDVDAVTSKRVHEAVPERFEKPIEPHASASSRDNAETKDLQKPARDNMQLDEVAVDNTEQPDAGAHSSMRRVVEQVQVASLTAKVEAQEMLITTLKDTNKMLWEEVVDSRGNRKDVTKISERMLLTLEAMALGGRLERPKSNPHAEQQGSDAPQHPEVEIVQNRERE